MTKIKKIFITSGIGFIIILLTLFLIFIFQNKTDSISETFEDLGPAAKTLGLVGGQIGLNAQNEAILYVTTRSENPARLIIFNLDNEQIEDVLPIGSATIGWATAIDKSGNVYIGTRNRKRLAEVYKYQQEEKRIVKLITIPKESMVWSLAVDNDQLYIGTYPNAKVFLYDLQKEKLIDLGTAVSNESIVRCLAVGTNHKIYAGFGTHASFVVFNSLTWKWKDILLGRLKNESFVYSCSVSNGKLFAGTEPSGKLVVWDEESLRLEAIIDTGQATIDTIFFPENSRKAYLTTRPEGILFEYDIDTKTLKELVTPKYHHQTRFLGYFSGSLLGVSGSGYIWKYRLNEGSLTVYNLQELGVKGNSDYLVSMVNGPDGNLYIGGHRLLRSYNPKTNKEKVFWIPGEPQALGSDRNFLYMGIYPGAELWRYDPDKPYRIERDSAENNPNLIGRVEAGQNRPRGVFRVYKDKIFLGTAPYYGKLTGAVVAFNKKNQEIQVYKVFNHNVYALTVCSNKLIVGTSIYGEGVKPQAKEAKLLVYETEPFRKIFESIPIPSQGTIYSLTCLNKIVYGLTDGGYLFAFDPEQQSILWKQHYFDKVELWSSHAHPNLISTHTGIIYGTTGFEFFRLNPRNQRVTILKKAETGYLVEGRDGHIYLNIGKHVFRYRTH